MSQRIVLEPAFVLHSRPYSNTSLIVELFTMRHGRVVVIARSARGLKSRYRGKLQAFLPMLVSWSGTRELKNLGNIELSGAPYQLQSDALLCGFYLNELLMHLMQRDDPHPNLYEIYQHTLNALEHKANIEKTLRYFEKNLLKSLGYGLSLSYEAHSGTAIEPGLYYQYVPEHGFVQSEPDQGDAYIFLGNSLLSLHHEDLIDEQSLRDAKRLMRMVLSHYLGGKPLRSREMLT